MIWRSRAIRGDASTGQVHPVKFTMSGKGTCSIFLFQCVDMDRTIRRLCGHKLVEGVPGHSLNVMTMLSNLADQLACKDSAHVRPQAGPLLWYLPVCALNILAVLSTPPVMKNTPSGDQARS
jgi:hypothetical protein